MQPTAELTIHVTGEEEVTVPLGRQFIIGSRSDADLVLGADGVAATHLILNPSKRGALLLVFDQQGKVPVVVNGASVAQSRRLTHGDRITLANVALVYLHPSQRGPERREVQFLRAEGAAAADSSGSSILDSQRISWFAPSAETAADRALRTLYRLSSLSSAASSENALQEGAVALAIEGTQAAAGALVRYLEGSAPVPLVVTKASAAPPGYVLQFSHEEVKRTLIEGVSALGAASNGAATLYVPIVRQGGETESALCLERLPGSAPFQQGELELAASVGRQLAAALDRVRLLKQLRASGNALGRMQRSFEAVLTSIPEGLVLVGPDLSLEPLAGQGQPLLARLLGHEVGERLPGDSILGQLVVRASLGESGLSADLPTADGEGLVSARFERVSQLESVVLVLTDVTALRRAEEAHRARERALQAELLEISAREQRRIGHDLHDGLCQQLLGVSLLAKKVEGALRREGHGSADDAGKVVELLNQGIGQAYALAKGLCPAALEQSLPLALADLVAHSRRLFEGASVAFEAQDELALPCLDPGQAGQVYQIVQEAVSNAQKHAGARRIVVRLRASEGALLVEVEDDGRGLPAADSRRGRAQGGMGLTIMEHRASLLGARLSFEQAEAGGTRVVCRVPKGISSARVASGGVTGGASGWTEGAAG